ncbi:hypothetical protein CCY99_04940 [Helicobacter sp. 16-1353]|uniref:Crp/Fnr family transcriptional regulator n=1 Tax=Helicobacter sp. 16-1353 TaxID=2004996 RepID=UPI000DCD319F|nr:Crp/Fnr family transcriptional regulator [Helicobacter sp. 16-1353]RAX54029.1 hypothetical protein CCY99_04940 [Helicobacter sp. 16-1353]
MYKIRHCPLSCSVDLKLVLENMDDFKNIKPATFEEIINISHIKEYQKDSILYYENDIVDNVHYLFHGLVKVYKINKFDNEVIVNLLHNYCANESNPPLIDYHTFLSNNSFFNILCLENCKILSINVESFKEIIKSDPALSLNMLNRANKIIEEQEYIININMIYDTKSKLASLLNKNYDVFNMLSKKVVSQMLNISQETLSRSIKKLKDENIIGFDNNKKIIIVDEQKLRSIL